MSTEVQTSVTLSAETPSVLPPEQAGATSAAAGTDKPADKDKPTPKAKEKAQDNSMGLFGALFNVKGQGSTEIADKMKGIVNDSNGPFGQIIKAFQTVFVSLLKPFLEKMGIDVSKLGKDEPAKPEKKTEPEKPQVAQRKAEAPMPEASPKPEQPKQETVASTSPPKVEQETPKTNVASALDNRTPGFAEQGLDQAWNKRTWDPGRQPGELTASAMVSHDYEYGQRGAGLVSLFDNRAEDPGKLRSNDVAPAPDQNLVASMTMKTAFAPG
ncbi:MAG: hypothetical protein IT558_00965 [Alphaproteobacteria bacterium]|nr:hypothetical protein [Alphaproteobacteria bacterium]